MADTVPPAAVSFVIALWMPDYGNDIQIHWENATDDVGVAGYEVHRGATPGFTPSAATLRTVTVHPNPEGEGFTSRIEHDVPDGQWYYRVIAIDAAGNKSAPSTEGGDVYVNPPLPSAPTNLTATVYGDAVSLTWDHSVAPGGVYDYRVYRGLGAGFTADEFTLIGSPSSNGWTDTDLPDGTYYYKVRVMDLYSRYSEPSEEVSAVVGTGSGLTEAKILLAVPDPTALTAADAHLKTVLETQLAGMTVTVVLHQSALAPPADIDTFNLVVFGDAMQSNLVSLWDEQTVPVLSMSWKKFPHSKASNASYASTGDTRVAFWLFAHHINSPLYGTTTVYSAEPSSGYKYVTISSIPQTSGISFLARHDFDYVRCLGMAIEAGGEMIDGAIAPSRRVVLPFHDPLVMNANAIDILRRAVQWTARDLGAGGPDVTAPSVPLNLKATVTGGSDIRLTWSTSLDAIGVVGYEVHRSTTPDFVAAPATLLATLPGDALTYVDEAPAAGVRHYYRIVAFDAANNRSAGSVQASALIAATFGLRFYEKSAGGLVPLALGGIYSGNAATTRTNLVPNPRPVADDSTPFELRRNRAVNPGPTTTGGWGSNSAALSVTDDTTKVRRPGSRSRKSTVQAAAAQSLSMYALGISTYTTAGRTPCTPGETITASAYFAAARSDTRAWVGVEFYDASNVRIGSRVDGPFFDLPSGQDWGRATVTVTAPANTATVGIMGFVSPRVGAPVTVIGDVAWVQDVVIESGSVASEYFDGGTTYDPLLVPSWTGTANASASILSARPPAFWGGSAGGRWPYLVTDEDGIAVELTDPVGGSGGYVEAPQKYAAVPGIGRWAAFGVEVKPLTGDQADKMRLHIRIQQGSTNVNEAFSATGVGWTPGQWTRQTVAVQQTAAADNVDARIWPTQTTNPGPQFRARHVVVAFADTEAEALTAVETFFDGDTPDFRNKRYVWASWAHESESIETVYDLDSTQNVEDSGGTAVPPPPAPGPWVPGPQPTWDTVGRSGLVDPPALTAEAGTWFSTGDATIEHKRYPTGPITHTGDDLILRGVVVPDQLVVRGQRVLIENCDIGALVVGGGAYVTVRRCRIGQPQTTTGDGVRVTSDTGQCHDVVIEDCYIGRPALSDTSHYDSLRVRGCSGLIVRGNYFDAGQTFDPRYDASIFLENARGGNVNVLIEGNWSRAAGHRHLSLWASDVTIRNNVFYRTVTTNYANDGVLTGSTVISGNVDDLGAPVAI